MRDIFRCWVSSGFIRLSYEMALTGFHSKAHGKRAQINREHTSLACRSNEDGEGTISKPSHSSMVAQDQLNTRANVFSVARETRTDLVLRRHRTTQLLPSLHTMNLKYLSDKWKPRHQLQQVKTKQDSVGRYDVRERR